MAESTENVSKELENSQATKKLAKKICLAANSNNLERVKELAEEINVNTPYLQGYTALHYACNAQHMDVVIYLLSQQGNLELRNDQGRTARSYLNLESTQKLAQYYLEEAKKKAEAEAKKNGKKSKSAGNANATGNEPSAYTKPIPANGNGHAEYTKPIPTTTVTPKTDKKKEKELSTMLCTMKNTTLSFDDRSDTFNGTNYILNVQNPPENSELVFEAIGAGHSCAGRFRLGVNIPNNPNYLPLMTLTKTENHDFFIKRIIATGKDMSAEIGVFSTPENYHENPLPSSFPRMSSHTPICLNMGDDPKPWGEYDQCLERAHSPERSRSSSSSRGQA